MMYPKSDPHSDPNLKRVHHGNDNQGEPPSKEVKFEIGSMEGVIQDWSNPDVNHITSSLSKREAMEITNSTITKNMILPMQKPINCERLKPLIILLLRILRCILRIVAAQFQNSCWMKAVTSCYNMSYYTNN